MADIIIDIASEFTGKKAFKQAENSTEALMKNVKKLAKTLGVAYGTQQILAFGKASIRAAAADQKAQQQLALALNNVGLGRDAASSEAYIQRLQSEFGIVDDLLRPAYQTLAVATRDSAEAQRLLNLSLDISASTGRDLSNVTAALSKAFLGNNTALSKLGVGISKADLKAKSFEDITNQLAVTFAGSATAAAGTFQGSIDKLGVASNNVKEIIGTGLIDALKNLGKDQSVADLADNMEKTATYLADVIRGVGVLAGKLKDIPVLGNLNVGMIPIVGSYIELLRKAGTQTGTLTAADNAHLKSLQDSFKITTKTVKAATTLTKLSTQQLKDLRLKKALEKANLALGKGTNVFDLDKIQIAAALTNQAEQLGNATSAAQLLQIANDTARLNVKRSILALEDAIASKDEAAIIAATNKLNADLGILGALSNQKTQIIAIESILKGLAPKDLINQGNLDEALRKIREMLALLAQVKPPTVIPPAVIPPTVIPPTVIPPTVIPPTGIPFFQTPNGISPTTPARSIEEINKAVEDLGGVVSVIGKNGIEFTKLVDSAAPVFQELEDSVAKNLFIAQGILTQPFNAGSFRAAEGGSIFRSGAVGSRDRDINITIQANTIASPDELTSMIQNSIISLNKRGDYLTTAGSL
jgi:hypothetical protein